MKLKMILFLFIIVFFTNNIAFSQLLVNKGTVIQVTKGVSVYVDGAVQNDAGTIDVDNTSGISELIVNDNFVNNATAQGSGYYKIYGNWINNNTFTAGTGTVFLEGTNQLLSGTSSTTFHNLTLNGSGVKTLGIDQTCTGVLSLNNLELSTLNYKFFVTNFATNSITRTTGFVSSTNGGFLSRTTNTTGVYLFPVGSSSGTNRYRPVEIQPNNTNANTYTVRLANVNPTSETYNVDLLANDICEVNSNFYHQINRTSGSTSANLSIYYDNSADGSWDGIANWGTSPNQWNIVTGSSTASGSPMYKAIVSNWNTFSNIPYSLYKVAPNVNPTSNSPICEGGTIQLNEIGGEAVSWAWSGPNGFTSNLQNPSISGANILASGTYTVTITGSACQAVGSVSVTVNPKPDIPVATTDCSGGVDQGIIMVTSPTGANYEYSIDGTFQASTSFGPLANGNYTITVNDTNTGCSSTGSSINLSCGCANEPSLTLSASSGGICEYETLSLSGNTFGGSATEVTITHNGNGNLTNTNFTSSPFTIEYTPATGDIGNTVTITVTTDNPEGSPCTSSISNYNLSVYARPNVILSGNSPICEGESTQLTASGSGTYAWNHSSETSANVTVNPNTETTYTVTITDNHSCTNTDDFTITVNPKPDIPVAITDCSGGIDQGIITVTSPTGANYEYSIDGTFQASTSFGPLANGNYTITVNDINTGCSSIGNPINLSCGCTNEPSLTLSENTGEICGNQAFTLDGNSFGGSATEVTISHNGNGNLDIASSTTSPFDFTYTPSSEDYGNTVIITIITDNPQGEPCQVASATFSLDVLDIPN
ncbi:MAG: hypothetical protein RBR32_08260, partial [Bacteroidales bacterium]|nr:hypothetical protein [Bacteroidales bacterium]